MRTMRDVSLAESAVSRSCDAARMCRRHARLVAPPLITSTMADLSLDLCLNRCGPCRRIAPFVEELSNKYRQTAKFIKVDVDEVWA